MAVFKPADPPQQKAKRIEEVCPSECFEPDLDVEVPLFVRLPRKRIRRVRFHVRNRRRWTPNLNFPEAEKWGN